MVLTDKPEMFCREYLFDFDIVPEIISGVAQMLSKK